ncbi:hypothetical protein LN446_001322 [Salmonella enterica]|nr:hypothetical protein [Salmonella enterica]EDW4357079.1 hypothetical protein [Salmonella enterica subsp. salamae]EDS7876562.1 hypothetical protein [Salmonella enterica]EDX9483386.1 hypothetical protein [Salmonella enterica]EEG0754649.1 hypothetical protein [Salmonella enterica]
MTDQLYTGTIYKPTECNVIDGVAIASTDMETELTLPGIKIGILATRKS